MGAHYLVGRMVVLQQGPFTGMHAKVLDVSTIAVKTEVELFRSKVEVTVPPEAVGLDSLPTKEDEEQKPKDRYDYIGKNLEEVEAEDPYKSRFFTEHDVAIAENWIWFSGYNNAGDPRYESNLKVYFVANLCVVKLPLFCITKPILKKLNKKAGKLAWRHTKDAVPPSKGKNMFTKPNLNAYQWQNLEEYDPGVYLEFASNPLIDANMEAFLRGDIIPANLRFLAMPRIKDGFCCVPIVPRHDFMRETLYMPRWGMFEDRMHLLSC